MSKSWRVKHSLVVVGLLLCLWGQLARAEDRWFEMLQGLRGREYFDYAVLYLDQLQADPKVAANVKEILPLERGITFQEWGKAERDPERQQAHYDDALKTLDEFLRNAGQHPRVPQAYWTQGDAWLGKARALAAAAAKATSGKGTGPERPVETRPWLEQARRAYTEAITRYETQYKELAGFIDEKQDPAKYRRRQQIELGLINSLLNRAQASLEESKTYTATDPQFQSLVKTAAGEFQKIHSRFRNVIAGRYARLYEGRCYEALGDTQKSLGVYQELLADKDSSDAVRALQDLTLQYRATSLNNADPPQHQLVVTECENWIKLHGGTGRSTTAVAIRWELTRAYLGLAGNRDLLKPDQERLWRQALNSARLVNRFPGELREPSLKVVREMEDKLGNRDKLPEKFDAAFALGQQQIGIVKGLRDDLEKARADKRRAEDIQRIEVDLKNEMQQTQRVLEHAVRLAAKEASLKDATAARYLLGYAYYLDQRSYEAAILCEYAAKSTVDENSDAGIDAAYLAMASYVQAFNSSKAEGADKEIDLQLVTKACRRLIKLGPNSPRAGEARIIVGRLFNRLGRPRDAIPWFEEVPEDDPKSAEAQIFAGQAHWSLYVQSANRGEATTSSAESKAWKEKATKQLRSGIAKSVADLDSKAATPSDLTAAKLSLAQILVTDGKDKEAISVLTQSPHSVVDAVKVPDEKKRPEKGVLSRVFVTEVFKLLMRANIGAGQLEEARAAMSVLEKNAGGAGADLTELYVGLGRLLRDELEKYRVAGETERYSQLLKSFERFLADMLGRKEGQSYGTLSWIGETYLAIGEAANHDPLKATDNFSQGEKALRLILERAASDSKFATDKQQWGVKLRMAHAQRLKKDYEKAEETLLELIKSSPNDLRAQIGIAQTYQDWGAVADETERSTRLLNAMGGRADMGVWGWGPLSTRLQQLIEKSDRSDLLETFYDARYRTSLCRRDYALLQTDAKKKKQQLDKAAVELLATVSISRNLPESERERMNSLYRDVLQSAGAELKDLPTNAEEMVSAPPTAPAPVEESDPVAAKPAAMTPKPSSTTATQTGGSGLMTSVLMGAIVVGFLAITGFLISSKPKRLTASRRSVAPTNLQATLVVPPQSELPDFDTWGAQRQPVPNHRGRWHRPVPEPSQSQSPRRQVRPQDRAQHLSDPVRRNLRPRTLRVKVLLQRAPNRSRPLLRILSHNVLRRRAVSSKNWLE